MAACPLTTDPERHLPGIVVIAADNPFYPEIRFP
jgi:hypothetical protein